MPNLDQFSKLIKKHSALFYSFLFSLGVLVSGLATLTLFENTQYQTVFSNVVTNISAALIFATLIYSLKYFFDVSGSGNKEIVISCQSKNVVSGSDLCGLVHTYENMGCFGKQKEWIELIENSKAHVNIMGRSLYGWTLSSKTVDVIANKAKQGVKFRWLFMNEKNRFLPEIIEQDVNIGVQLTEKLRAVCKLIEAVHQKLPIELASNFQVRQFKNAPLYFSILNVDDITFINHYLFSASSENSPFIKMKGNYQAWPQIYLEEFETIWRMAEEPVCDIVATSEITTEDRTQ